MSKYQLDTKNIWFPDQREPVYDPNDPVSDYQFKEYWKREKDRCMNGFDLADGQVHISGFLYWHTVYWKIGMYIEVEQANGKVRKVREVKVPLLRDIEWDVSHDLTRCEDEGKFYDLVGSRDFGKSIIAGSLAGWTYTFFDNSECVISGGADNYIKLATDKIEDGLTNLHPYWKKKRLANDWKREIRAGWKDKNTNQRNPKSSNSVIFVRNYENGNKTMAANGTRPSFHLIDEIGTIPNLIGCVKDSDACWWSGGGDKPSCLTMLAGTGGDMEVGIEASEIFYTPEAYNMLSFDDEWEGNGKIGKFVDALKSRMKYKEPKTLAEYTGINHPDLQKITILVTNPERAKKEWWDIKYAEAVKSGNPKAIIKFKAYWPLVPSDSFLTVTRNDFNIDAAKSQQKRLKNSPSLIIPVHLYHDGTKITHEPTDKKVITQFPLKDQSKDAPVCIIEFPPENIPFGLYTAGVDPYRFDESENSGSLGAVYIFKRIHEINSEKFSDMLVAWYVARPALKSEWQEQARLLIKMYGAITLCENDEYSFIDYMVGKGDGHYMADKPEWIKQLIPTSTDKRPKGVSRASTQVRNMLDGTFKSYMDDEFHTERDEKGSIVVSLTGVSKIHDPMLLEEVVKYNNSKGNYDRIVAAELAIAQARKMDPYFTVSSTDEDPRLKSYFSKKGRSSTFRHALPSFAGNKRIR
jgi:hypothetical protein